MRENMKKWISMVIMMIMILPTVIPISGNVYAAENDLKFTKLQIFDGTTVVADLLKGETPKLKAGKDYSFVVDYNVPGDLQFKPTYLDVKLGNGLYFTSFPGAKYEVGAISSTSFDEFTIVPDGKTGSPYGYPGNNTDERGNLKNRTGLAEFKTKNSLTAVSSKNEITFRVDDAFESKDSDQLFKDVIEFNLRTDNTNNLDTKILSANATDTPSYTFENAQSTEVVSLGKTTSELSAAASTGKFLTEAGSKTTVQVVYPSKVVLESLKETSRYNANGTMGETKDDGTNKTTTFTFDEPGGLISNLNFKPYINVPASSGYKNNDQFKVTIKNLNVDVWKDSPDSVRTSKNEAVFTVKVLDGNNPEVLTRIALTDTMPNWSKAKYDTYNVRLGSMLLKNEIDSATTPKTLELKIDKADTAVVRGVTIPYWKDIEYGPISWTSKSGKSGILTDYSKLKKGAESALIKNTALGLDINDSISSIKVDLGAIPGAYIGTKYVEANLYGSTNPGAKNNDFVTWQAFYDWGYYPVGIWGTWKKGTDENVVTEAKLYKTGSTASADETYDLIGKSGKPIVKNGGYGKIDKNQINGSDATNNSFHISGDIGSSDWDYTPLQEPVIYVIMPDGFKYSNLTLTGGTLSDPIYVGEFDHGTTKVKVWKYDVALASASSTNGQYQPDFAGKSMKLNMDIAADGIAKVGTYHINDFIGLTTKDFKDINAEIQSLRWQASNWNTKQYTSDFGLKVNSGETMASISEGPGIDVKQAAEISAQSRLIVPSKTVGAEDVIYLYDDTSDQTKKDTTAVLSNKDTAIQRIVVRNTVPVEYETNEDGNVKKDPTGKPVIKNGNIATIDLYVPLMTKIRDFGPGFTPEGSLKLPLTLKNIKASDNFTVKYLKIKDEKKYQLNTKPDPSDYEVVTDPDKANMVQLTSKTALKYGDGGTIDIEYAAENLDSTYNNYVNVVTPVLDYNLDGNKSTLTKEPAAVSFYTPGITISGKKTWNDANNQDGIRPSKVTFELYADGVKKFVTDANGNRKELTAEASENSNWKYSFENLPKTVDGTATGREIKYTVKEIAVPGYKGENIGFDFTNTHAVEKINISGTKIWKDDSDRDGVRPDSVTVKLFADGIDTGKTATASADKNWRYDFPNLDKNNAGHEIKYTVKEIPADKYVSSVDGFDITNKHEIATTNIDINKKWVDGNNAMNLRPESIKIHLIADGKEVDSRVVTADSEGVWKTEFRNIPIYKEHGTRIEYSVKEDSVSKYTATYSGDSDNGFTITNTQNWQPITVDPPVKKKVIGNPETDSTFKFELVSEDPASPMPKGSVNGKKYTSIIGTGASEFGKIEFNKPGHYVYEIREINTGEKNYKFDNSVYKIVFDVTDVNRKLEVSQTILKNNQKVESDEFVNKYKTPVADKINSAQKSIKVVKTGDSSGIALYALLLLAAMAGLMVLLIKKRRNNK